MDPTGTRRRSWRCRQEPAFACPPGSLRGGSRPREAAGYTVVDPSRSPRHTHGDAAPRVRPTCGPQPRPRRSSTCSPAAAQARRRAHPNLLPLGDVIRFCAAFCAKRGIRDLRSVFERWPTTPARPRIQASSASRVRHRLARHITARFKNDDGTVAALVLDPRARRHFRSGSQERLGAARARVARWRGACIRGVAYASPSLVLP